jgi:RNA polymerase sigma-70 factor, ECF subfamily
MGDRFQALEDAELVVLARDGHLDAFNCLAGRWEQSIFRFSRRMLGDTEDARDVCQEALVKAYLNLGRLREPARFKAWAHHIALNLCRDRQRSRKHREPTESYVEGEPGELRVVEGGRPMGSPEGDAHRSGLTGLVEEILATLPEEQRAAILLREYHGFTSEEIGQMTEVPAATVRTRIFYGLRTARRQLKERGITEAGLC